MRYLVVNLSYFIATILVGLFIVRGEGWGPAASFLASSLIAWSGGFVAKSLFYGTRRHKVAGLAIGIFLVFLALVLAMWGKPTLSLSNVVIPSSLWLLIGAAVGFMCTRGALPGLSSLMYVARLRYIQSIHEAPDRRNPDAQVRRFLPLLERWRAERLSREELARLRGDPFYYYLSARTRYYDTVYQDAVVDGVQRIVNVGCGSDTRAYRFQELLRSRGVAVLECDQAQLIAAKQQLVRWRQGLDYVAYLAIDLNDGAWPELERLLRSQADAKTLVMMEGVSPYVDAGAFICFLQFLSATLSERSQVAYDFKIGGVYDDYGRAGRTETPFRLSRQRGEVVAFHAAHGLRLDRLESSAELCARLLPGLVASGADLFREDGLVRLRVAPDKLSCWPKGASGTPVVSPCSSPRLRT